MAFYAVSPGELTVTGDPSAILVTYLGSCVGVAMYDREAMIGGLVHIILPTGSEDKEKTNPAYYARSGIPLLLDEIIKLGVSKANIVAAIAGGGFMLADRNLIEAISFHHQPEEAKENPEVVSVVHIADNISSMIGYGCEADAMANRIHQFAISSINLRSDDVDRIIEKLPGIVKRALEDC